MATTNQLHQLDQPVLLGANWIIAHLDRLDTKRVGLTVSITTEPEAPILGTDVVVRLVASPSHSPHADGEQLDDGLDPIEMPDTALALPMVQSKGATAFARYTFARPAWRDSMMLWVQFRGLEANFDVPLAAA